MGSVWYVMLDVPFFFVRPCLLAPHLLLQSVALEVVDVRQALLPPNNFSPLYMLKNHVDLLQLGVIDNLEKRDNVRMSNLLQNGDLPVDVLLRIPGGQFPQAAGLGQTRDNLDSHIFAILEVLSKFDLAMLATPYFLDDLVLVDEFAAGCIVAIDVGSTRFPDPTALERMEVRAVGYSWRSSSLRRRL